MGPAAVAFLPEVVRYGFLLHWPLAGAAGFCLSLASGMVLLRSTRETTAAMHWMEKARRVTSFRVLLGVNYVLHSLLIGAIAYKWCGTLAVMPPECDALGAI